MRKEMTRFLGLLTAILVCSAGLLPGSLSEAGAYGPGSYAYGGPGDTTPSQNSYTIYAYPGFHGTGPRPGQIALSWEDRDGGPAEDSYEHRTGDYECGWRYSPDGWWYQYADGSWPAGCWKNVDGRWYYFREDGHLYTGWLEQNGYAYYLNPADDGTYGSMRTGWQLIDGKLYYFNASDQGVLGAMLRATVTPDGYTIGADGVYHG